MPPSAPAAPDALATVDRLLRDAVTAGASDIHLDPSADGVEVRMRRDGLLQHTEQLSAEAGRAAIARLMVMGGLLTYRLDVPQEGRMQAVVQQGGGASRLIEARVAVMPTTHGLRAVVRLPAELTQPRDLEALQLPPRVLDGLRRLADADAGLLLVTGPAGSGKTTTLYALLEWIAQRHAGLSIISLEDPVERDLPGVTQIEVRPFGELTYERALKSVLRQDPQVLMLGEIRDRATASIAVQAALSGHRLVSTMHAGSPGGAIARLLEMGLEPYQITSALFGVVAQRLLRRRSGDGYEGRIPAAAIATIDAELRRCILQRDDEATLQRALQSSDAYQDLRASARTLVEQGVTDEEEMTRVMGADA